MLKLTARIRVQRLFGSLEKVASEGSGGPLQAKTAWPSHDEQVIAPDEDYYGLVSVKVMPVPRKPACAVSLESQSAFVVENVVNVDAESSVIAEDVDSGGGGDGTHAYYNDVLLPIIPQDVLAVDPYAIIVQGVSDGIYQLWALDTITYLDGTKLRILPTDGYVYYNYDANSDAWVYAGNGSGTRLIVPASHVVVWSNHDIPNGSATATEIYFEGTEPVPA